MRHALITGGSRGIGAAAVRAFTAAGYAVSFFYEKNDAAAAAVSAETGAEAVRCDVADAQAVQDAVSRLPETDVLVNNAGICHYGLLSQITQAQWDRLFAVNVGGIYHCVNAVLPAMLHRQSGCIINVSSMWGQVGASCGGIGAAAVRAFTAAGYAVSFFYEKNDAAAAAVSAETGAEAVRCDVADAQAVQDAVSRLPETDVLVNNAGICHYGLLSQITQAQWDRLFAVNVGGIYHCVNAVLPAMLHRQSGCIINVSSMWGQVGASCEACYSATKGAVLALTKALAQELGPSGIRVNCVSPGVILTDMVANVAPEVLAELAQEAPLGKNGTPEDVARAMVYLAEAEFVTGQNLPVNGGFVL